MRIIRIKLNSIKTQKYLLKGSSVSVCPLDSKLDGGSKNLHYEILQFLLILIILSSKYFFQSLSGVKGVEI